MDLKINNWSIFIIWVTAVRTHKQLIKYFKIIMSFKKEKLLFTGLKTMFKSYSNSDKVKRIAVRKNVFF